MSNLNHSINESPQVAGTSYFEVLLFSLGMNITTGRNEVFGINVFKVKEVMHIPEITHVPEMPYAVEGMVSLRGVMIPIINLPKYCNVETHHDPKILMITEHDKRLQGFLVHAVDTIVRLNRSDVKAPPEMVLDQHDGFITSVANLEREQLVMIIDVEKILSDTASMYGEDDIYSGTHNHSDRRDITVLFADDSIVARSQISRTLDNMGISYIAMKNGVEAWTKLNEIADHAEKEGRTITSEVQLVLTDIEMPEMDGYALTDKIKAEPRFNDLSVVMHSSLISDTNKSVKGDSAIDVHAPKFKPHELAIALDSVIASL